MSDELLVFYGRRLTFREACSENPWLRNEVGEILPRASGRTVSSPRSVNRLYPAVAILPCLFLFVLALAGWYFAFEQKWKVERAQNANRMAESDMRKLNTEKQTLIGRIAAQEQELAASADKINDLECSKLTAEAKIKSCEAKREELIREIGCLKAAVDVAKSQYEQIRLEKCDIEARELVANTKCREQALEILELKDKIQQHQAAMESANEENVAVLSKCQMVENANQALAEENADLSERLEVALNEASRLREASRLVESEKQSIVSKNSDLSKELNQLKGEISDIERTVRAVQAEKQALEKKDSEEIVRLKKNIVDLQKLINDDRVKPESQTTQIANIDIILDGNPLKTGETVRVLEAGRERIYKTPVRWNVTAGRNYGGNIISYTRDGKLYYGKLERFKVNWKGDKTFVVALKKGTEGM